jgi:hypothetical protein
MGDSAQTPHDTNPGKKSASSLFLGDENIFKKSASMVTRGISKEMVPWSPILKNVLIFEEKGGALMLLKTTLHLEAKAQYISTSACTAVFLLFRRDGLFVIWPICQPCLGIALMPTATPPLAVASSGMSAAAC